MLNDTGKHYRTCTHTINTNTWSCIRESRNRDKQDQAGVDVVVSESNEHVVRKFAQHLSRSESVV